MDMAARGGDLGAEKRDYGLAMRVQGLYQILRKRRRTVADEIAPAPDSN